MPFKSQAQRRKFAQLLEEGKISNETFEDGTARPRVLICSGGSNFYRRASGRMLRYR
jgi:hypothetical protein